VKALISGGGGQLGRGLQRLVPEGIECTALQRCDLDITDPRSVSETISRYRPDWIINAAAYTAVDRAEAEPDIAFAVNRDGVANLAIAARDIGARVLHVSTDYVFDGRGGRPYRPDDAPAPLNVYGESKREGEIRLAELLSGRHALVRASWLYGLPGRNFVSSMLKLMKEKQELRVVCDQVGSPTAVPGLVGAIWRIVEREAYGVYHWCDAGVASWYDFAVAIQAEANAQGLLSQAVRIIPVLSTEFPTAALRPSFSVLDSVTSSRLLGFELVHWRTRLSQMLAGTRRPA